MWLWLSRHLPVTASSGAHKASALLYWIPLGLVTQCGHLQLWRRKSRAARIRARKLYFPSCSEVTWGVVSVLFHFLSRQMHSAGQSLPVLFCHSVFTCCIYLIQQRNLLGLHLASCPASPLFPVEPHNRRLYIIIWDLLAIHHPRSLPASWTWDFPHSWGDISIDNPSSLCSATLVSVNYITCSLPPRSDFLW